MSKRLQLWVITYPKQILLVVTALLIASIASLTRIQSDPNPEILPLTHESRVNLREERATFTGSHDIITVMLETDETVFNQATLQRIKALTQAFRTIEVVSAADEALLARLAASSSGSFQKAIEQLSKNPRGAQAADDLASLFSELPPDIAPQDKAALALYADHLHPIIRIHSLADTENILGTRQGLEVRPIFEQAPASAAEQAQLAKEVLGNELLRTVLVSDDGKRAGIYLETSLEVEDSKAAFAFYEQLEHHVRAIPGPERVFIAGTPITTANIAHTIDQDMGKLFPGVILLLLACLWLTFKMARGVAIPMGVVVVAIVVALGIQAAFGVPINVLSASLPVYLICVCLGDGIHLFGEYRTRCLEGLSREQAVRSTLDALFVPVILTSLTTAGAFFSLAWTPIIQLTHFGVIAGLGTLISMIFCLTAIPALFMVLPLPKAAAADAKVLRFDRWTTAALMKLHRAVSNQPHATAAAGLLIGGLALWGSMQVLVDNNRVEFFQPESELATSAEAIKSGLAGTETLTLLVESTRGDEPMKDPKVLRALDALEQHLAQNPLVGKTTSLASMVRRLSLVLHDNDPAYDRVPADEERVIGADGQQHTVPGKDLISQYVLLYENGGGGLLRDVLDFKAEKAKVRIDLRTNSSNEVRAVMNDVSSFVAQHFPSDLKTRFGGTGYVLIWAGNEIIFGQISNLLGSVTVVFLILLVAFRSLVKAILAMLPVLAAGLFNFGLLGALGVKLDIGTALVSSVAIGVGIDYAIHYVARLGQELAVSADPEAALEATMLKSGPAVVANALTVGTGFMVLLASDFIPINTIGWMICLTQATSSAATLILLPAILRVVRPAFLGMGRSISAPAALVGQP